jgi:hypothetical protein
LPPKLSSPCPVTGTHFEEPRRIDIPDGKLLEGIEALLGPHPEKDLQGPYGAYEELDVVTYGVATVAELRAKVEQRENPLWAIRILKRIGGTYVRVYVRNGYCEALVSADAGDRTHANDMTAACAPS